MVPIRAKYPFPIKKNRSTGARSDYLKCPSEQLLSHHWDAVASRKPQCGGQKLCFCHILSRALSQSKGCRRGCKQSLRTPKQLMNHIEWITNFPFVFLDQFAAVQVLQAQLSRSNNFRNSSIVCSGSRKRIEYIPISRAALTFASKSSMNTDSFGVTSRPSRAR